MNAKQLYLGWVRTNHPDVYKQALQMVLSPQRGMSGLGDDLTDSITGTGLDFSSQITGLSDTDASNLAAAAQSANDSGFSWSGLFDSIAGAVSTVAPVLVQTQAQQNLLAINTARAQQVPPLPPLTANGVPVTAAMLAPATSTTAQLEAALSGGGGIVLLLGLGLLGVAIMAGSRHG